MCLPKPTELCSTGSDPDAKPGLQLTTASLTRCDKHSAGAALPTGEGGAGCTGWARAGEGDVGTPYFVLRFSVNLKLLCKSKAYPGAWVAQLVT